VVSITISIQDDGGALQPNLAADAGSGMFAAYFAGSQSRRRREPTSRTTK
jgi:hypothetical protein